MWVFSSFQIGAGLRPKKCWAGAGWNGLRGGSVWVRSVRVRARFLKLVRVRGGFKFCGSGQKISTRAGLLCIVKLQSLQFEQAASHQHYDEQSDSAVSPAAALASSALQKTQLQLAIPGWLCLIDRPQPFQYFATATAVLQALTAPDLHHLQCFPFKTK